MVPTYQRDSRSSRCCRAQSTTTCSVNHFSSFSWLLHAPSTFCCCLPLIHLAVSCFAPILHTAKMRSRLNLLVGCHSIYSKLYGIKHRVNIVFVCNGRFFFSGVTHISIHHQSWTFDLTAMYTVTRSHSAGPPPFGMLSATAITYNVNTHIALYIP